MNKNHPPATLLYTHTRMLHSNIVDDDYELSIWLPPGYGGLQDVTSNIVSTYTIRIKLW